MPFERGALTDLVPVPGRLVVVTGEDGCGTSTLLRSLAETSAGAVLLPQPPGDDWVDSDVVAAVLPAGGAQLLAELGAGDLPLDRQMWMVSGGQRQRVRLARVLADPAPVLLLDEPLGYLDGGGVRAALALLRGRADAGTGVVMVAKGDDRAFAVADQVLELADGALRLRAE